MGTVQSLTCGVHDHLGIEEKSPNENTFPFGFTVFIWGSPYGNGEAEK